jgi:hypothetical protein
MRTSWPRSVWQVATVLCRSATISQAPPRRVESDAPWWCLNHGTIGPWTDCRMPRLSHCGRGSRARQSDSQWAADQTVYEPVGWNGSTTVSRHKAWGSDTTTKHRPGVRKTHTGHGDFLVCCVLMTKFDKSGKIRLSGLLFWTIWFWQFQDKTKEWAKLKDLKIQGVLRHGKGLKGIMEPR